MLCKTLCFCAKESFRWDFSAGSESPTYFIFSVAPKRFFLPVRGQEKTLNFTEIQGFTQICFSYLWCHQESNRGHKDFQSFALPTELWHQRLIAVQIYSILHYLQSVLALGTTFFLLYHFLLLIFNRINTKDKIYLDSF